MASDKDKEQRQYDIENIIDIFNNSNWNELQIKTDEFEIFLSTDPAAQSPVEKSSGAETQNLKTRKESQQAPQATTSDEITNATKEISVPDGMLAIRAPHLGTYYGQPKPGEPAYVKVGRQVNEDSEVCLLEVMKLFTAVRAGVKGTIREICVEDGVMVEHDQILMIMEPSD